MSLLEDGLISITDVSIQACRELLTACEALDACLLLTRMSSSEKHGPWDNPKKLGFCGRNET